MSEPNDGNYSAFPVTYDPTGVRTPGTTADGAPVIDDGMTLRQYAAIHLRVPNSGEDWLDDMIREAQRDELAGQALAGVMANPRFASIGDGARIALALDHADAMLAARNSTHT